MKRILLAAAALLIATPAEAHFCPPPVPHVAAIPAAGASAPAWPFLLVLAGIEGLVYAEATQVDPWTGNFPVVDYTYPGKK